jgi:hypothetical protein
MGYLSIIFMLVICPANILILILDWSLFEIIRYEFVFVDFISIFWQTWILWASLGWSLFNLLNINLPAFHVSFSEKL